MAQINGLQPFGNFSLIYQRICLRRTLFAWYQSASCSKEPVQFSFTLL